MHHSIRHFPSHNVSFAITLPSRFITSASCTTPSPSSSDSIFKTTLFTKEKSKSTGGFYEKLAKHQKIYASHLLMARVGDFYEFYFDQAHIVSHALGIKLARLKRKSSKADQVFCGFPSYKLNDHVKSLLDCGFSVAKYEQFENTLQDGRKLITRQVDRIYTPGTLIEECFIESAPSNHLVSIHMDMSPSPAPFDASSPLHGAVEPNECVSDVPSAASLFNDKLLGFSCVDLASGEFYMDECLQSELPLKLAAIKAREILVDENSYDAITNDSDLSPILLQSDSTKITKLSLTTFCEAVAFNHMATIFGVTEKEESSRRHALLLQIVPKGSTTLSLKATGALLDYIVKTHGGTLPLLDQPLKFDADVMAIDSDSQRSLELVRSIRNNDQRGTLLELLDKTATSSGYKELISRIRTCIEFYEKLHCHSPPSPHPLPSFIQFSSWSLFVCHCI